MPKIEWTETLQRSVDVEISDADLATLKDPPSRQAVDEVLGRINADALLATAPVEWVATDITTEDEDGGMLELVSW